MYNVSFFRFLNFAFVVAPSKKKQNSKSAKPDIVHSRKSIFAPLYSSFYAEKIIKVGSGPSSIAETPSQPERRTGVDVQFELQEKELAPSQPEYSL